MKKLVILADSCIHTKAWISFLKQKFEVHLITFGHEIIDEIKTYRIPIDNINIDGGNYKYLFQIFQIKKILNKIKPDLINAHYLTSYGLLAALLKGNTPLILSLHGSDILVTAERNQLYRLAARYTLAKSNHIFSVSNYMTEHLKRFITVSNNVTTVQYGVDVNKIHGHSDDTKIFDFISTRNIIKNSNINIIIDAFERYVHNVDSKSRLAILASGNLFESYKNVIAEKNLQNNIFMPGKVANDELIGYLNQAKVFISLTTSDGAPLSLLEAMAAGTVPIVSNINANSEWIQNGINGFISEIDTESLYDKMILAQNCNHKELSESAYQTVLSRGNKQINSLKILEVFDKYS